MEFYRKNKNLVLRPFGTGTSCKDTVYGECVENVSLENCIEHCNDSPYCHYGLYIEPKNSEKKYCLPLISKGGQNINGNLIFNKNNSKLSEITTFFYDSRYFDIDEKLPKNILFLGTSISLKLKYNNGENLYLTENLRFEKIKPSVFMGIYAPNNKTFQSRVCNNEKIAFHILNDFKNIDFDLDTRKFFWGIYSPETVLQSYIMESINSENTFIDSNTPFLMRTNLINNKIYYWNVDENFQLILTLDKPKNFTFEMVQDSNNNQSTTFTEKNTKMMEYYLQKNFESNVKIKKKESFISYLLLFLLLLLIFFHLLKI